MSKPKPWLPNATAMLAGVHPFTATDAQWASIELALGAALGVSEREQLAEIVAWYIAMRAVELNPPLAADAFKLLNDLEKAATAMDRALGALLDGSDNVAYRVKQLLDFQLRTICRTDGEPVALGAVYFVSPAPGMLLRAAAQVRKIMNEEPRLRGPNGESLREVRTENPNYAWNTFISRLMDFAEDRDMKISSRKDSDALGKISPFTKFVSVIQDAIPREYRKGSASPGALSEHIQSVIKNR